MKVSGPMRTFLKKRSCELHTRFPRSSHGVHMHFVRTAHVLHMQFVRSTHEVHANFVRTTQGLRVHLSWCMFRQITCWGVWPRVPGYVRRGASVFLIQPKWKTGGGRGDVTAVPASLRMRANYLRSTTEVPAKFKWSSHELHLFLTVQFIVIIQVDIIFLCCTKCVWIT